MSEYRSVLYYQVKQPRWMETLKVPGGHLPLAFASAFLGTSSGKLHSTSFFGKMTGSGTQQEGWSLTHAAVISDMGLLRLKIWPRK